MTIENISKHTYQTVGWTDQNKSIPEEHLNSIVQSAMNMQSQGFFAQPLQNKERANIKPFKIWLPHREQELDNALSVASIFAHDQCQNQIFNNVKAMIVYIISEPEHLKKVDINNIPYIQDEEGKQKILDEGESIFLTPYTGEHFMDWKYKQEWNDYSTFIKDLLDTERNKKVKKIYNKKPKFIVPYHMFSQEHCYGLFNALGFAQGAATLRCHELGYYSQFHSAFRSTISWQDFYGEKFHSERKWFPMTIQLIGTSPIAVKMSCTRNAFPAIHEKQSLISSDYEFKDQNLRYETPGKIPIINVGNKKEIMKKVHDFSFIPDHYIKFFMENYGDYSPNPKKLFKDCYNRRFPKCEIFYDKWIEKNTKK